MKVPVNISKIIRTTAGRFHCWCDSNMGVIRKENRNVPNHLWDEFERKLAEETGLNGIRGFGTSSRENYV